MSEVEYARARLFASIEAGSHFWAQEIYERGPVEVVHRALDGAYENPKREGIIWKIARSNPYEILESISRAGAYFLTPENPLWPRSLDDLAAPPIALTVKGDVTKLSSASLSIVGSRTPTNYGLRIATEFASGFVAREWSIISGGALGIDAAAHRGALIAEGSTIAVMATGINLSYPTIHESLYRQIEESGALVSELLPGTGALPSRFLTRNRLIAALSKSTLVVEAAFRSGSLRTARDAAELMRPVMAIPGPINSPTSEGCHRLIGERAAEIVTSVADAVEFLNV